MDIAALIKPFVVVGIIIGTVVVLLQKFPRLRKGYDNMVDMLKNRGDARQKVRCKHDWKVLDANTKNGVLTKLICTKCGGVKDV